MKYFTSLKLFHTIMLTVILSACGGGSESNQTPDPIAVQPVPEPVTKLTEAQAAAFLNRATFGATPESIDGLVSSNLEAWFDQQHSLPVTHLLPYIQSLPNQDEIYPALRVEGWWNQVVQSDDQLRQRLAFAWSQILVVSDQNDFLFNLQDGMADYYDTLAEHAFGNYRDLLEAVTLHPAMGIYLSMLGNQKPDPENNIRPDENFAREVMQLFTIGLEELNQDGTPKTDSTGNTIPTYDQTIIEGFAHVFTGWTFSGSSNFHAPARNINMLEPMEPWADFHDSGDKRLLNGLTLAAGQSARQDLEGALDNLFNHPNVGPFISYRLIQRLVTSNPSPEYVGRVATVFNDNGEGIRGDLWAVTLAILTDDEAMNGNQNLPDSFGKLREPLIRSAQLFRVLKAQTQSGSIPFHWPEFVYGQAPQRSASVFNFYQPNYQQAGAVAQNGLVAPEFQITTANNLTGMHNSVLSITLWSNDGSGAIEENDILIDITEFESMASSHSDLLDELNLIFMANQMSQAMYDELLNYLDSSTYFDARSKVLESIMLITTSSEYAIQR